MVSVVLFAFISKIITWKRKEKCNKFLCWCWSWSESGKTAGKGFRYSKFVFRFVFHFPSTENCRKLKILWCLDGMDRNYL